jgi:hypothetical protein
MELVKHHLVLNSSMYGDTSSTLAPVGGAYGAGRFGYSINNTASVATATTGASAATWADLNFDSDYSASAAAGGYELVSVPTSSLTNFDPLAVRGFQLLQVQCNRPYPSICFYFNCWC